MKKKTAIITGFLVLVIGILVLAWYLLSVRQYQNAVANITFVHVNAADIPDGVYIGECDVNFIYAKVKVRVEGGDIIGVDLLEHRNDRGSAAEGIGQRVIAEQKIDVDAVSGATNSSTVIKKAIDNALPPVAE